MASSAASFNTLMQSLTSQLEEIRDFDESKSLSEGGNLHDVKVIANEALGMIDDWEAG